MSNPRPQNIEEDDPDILALRAEALSSLISKEKKKVHIQQQVPVPVHSQFQHNSHISHGSPHQNFPANGIPHFGGMRPSPVRQTMYNNPPMYHQPMIQPRPSFAPPFIHQGRPQMMPLPQPHVNPNFVSQRTPGFGMQQDEEMPLMPETSSFEPTPPSRLSPRSAKFVAENEEALRRVRRSSSSERSRSPYKYRARSRSPLHKVNHIVRKRTRSKTPEKNGFGKYIKSRSPRRRSKKKRPSPRRNRGGFRYNNGNRDRIPRPETDRKSSKTPPKDEKVEEKKDNDQKSTSPSVATEGKKEEKREKTEQELEDELLASTDSEQSEKAGDDDDDFKMTLDEKDLDFLDDDEEESENEGRFKSKPAATEQKKPAAMVTGSSYKSNFSKGYDKSKNSYSRHDYKRGKYEESRRDRRSPLKEEKRHSSPIRKAKKSPEPSKKSPEVTRKAPTKEVVQVSKIIVLNKDKKLEAEKEVAKKEVAKKSEPRFKSTFMSVEPPADEKKKDEVPKKEDRIRLVRSSVVNRVEPLKKSESKKEKSIMKRLGGFINDTAKKPVNAAWAKEQIVKILCENLLRDIRVG